MSLNCGILGLPNVGKSTIFSALTAVKAEAANYPFCTIEPNVGRVAVPDPRLKKISELIPPKKEIPAFVEFVDIAGLVRGASKGEGLGNKFLGNLREVGMLVHVVRCFENDDIIHVDSSIDPVRDIETIDIELALADLEVLEKRSQRLERSLRMDKDTAKAARKELEVIDSLKVLLVEGRPAREAELDDDDWKLLSSFGLITAKPVIYVCNVDEDALAAGGNAFVDKVREFVGPKAGVLVLCGKVEADIAELETEEEKTEFLQMMGLEVSGLDALIRMGYETLGLRTYFTAGTDENRAWTFHEGAKAPEAAGIIHTDFQRGFIRAEVYHCDDLFELGSEQALKAKGKLRIEGKEYVVQDGDVLHFRFNV